MDITNKKNELIKVWTAFISSTITAKERKEFDLILTNFQLSDPDSFAISRDFLVDGPPSMYFFAASSFYSVISNHSSYLTDNIELYTKSKELIESLISKFSNGPQNVLNKLTQSSANK